MGRYCIYLLLKQAGGTPQILVFKTLRMIGRPGLYRMTHIGWIDFDLGSSPDLLGQKVATVATHQPWNIPNQSQPKPVRQEMCHPVCLWLRLRFEVGSSIVAVKSHDTTE